MTWTEGTVPFDGHETWYSVTGDLRSGRTPLIVLHGGPGAPHDYLRRYEKLAQGNRAVVFYDQVGCGRSTHLPSAPDHYWTLQLFLRELDAVLTHLDVRDRYSLLGQSWGGVLGSEHAVRKPPGLRSLVVANSPASIELWVSEANRLRDALPAEVQATLLAHERAGTTDDAAYDLACKVFNARHVCRVDPIPDEVERTETALHANPQVYRATNGPSEFHVIGTMREWSIVGRLHDIVVPTLLISGRFDEATPATVQPFFDEIPDVSWTIFENSSHMPHVEEEEECMRVVGKFLDQHD